MDVWREEPVKGAQWRGRWTHLFPVVSARTCIWLTICFVSPVLTFVRCFCVWISLAKMANYER